MFVTRRERVSIAPVATPVAARASGARSVKGAEGSFDQITLTAAQAAGPTFRALAAGPAFRDLAASLSQQVRTFNTTGKIQELRNQVASGTYRPDARETAARMLLLAEEQ